MGGMGLRPILFFFQGLDMGHEWAHNWPYETRKKTAATETGLYQGLHHARAGDMLRAVCPNPGEVGIAAG